MKPNLARGSSGHRGAAVCRRRRAGAVRRLAWPDHASVQDHAGGIGLGCAVLAAAIFTVCVRIEPLPPRRKRRGKRWTSIETPTRRQIWETAPGDFVESIFAAIGIMATPSMLFIGFGFAASRYKDFPDLMIATAIAGGAFALEGAFVSWRGRRMWDPPGQVRTAEQPKTADNEIAGTTK